MTSEVEKVAPELEAVARGLFEANRRQYLQPHPVSFEALHPDTRAKWIALARAAYRAMEPVIAWAYQSGEDDNDPWRVTPRLFADAEDYAAYELRRITGETE